MKQTVVITGASAGVGRATVRAFARRGADIGLLAHAIQGFTESLRCELLHDHSHVHVTMVQLPAMNTPQFDWVKSRGAAMIWTAREWRLRS
jgi:NAD(P)-dependent dehydrogenase (short-subunit alcohol dehydrogenase family)